MFLLNHRKFHIVTKNWNCPFAEQTLNVCIIWNISLAVLSDKMTAQTMKRQKFFQTHPILNPITEHFLVNSNYKNIFWFDYFPCYILEQSVCIWWEDVRKSLPGYVYTCLVFRSTKSLSEMRPGNLLSLYWQNIKIIFPPLFFSPYFL